MAKKYEDGKSTSEYAERAERSAGSAKLAGREWTRWYDTDAEHVAQALENRAVQLWDEDSERRLEIERNLRRWGIELSGLYIDNGASKPGRDTLRVNLTKSLTETITAKIGKLRPRPLILTDEGTFANKIRAKKLQRFVDGAYQQTDAYGLMPLVFRNAMLMGTGALHVTGHPHLGRFALENIFPLELLVDATEAARGPKHTRTIIRVYPADKDALMEDYPECAEAIEAASMNGPGSSMPTANIRHAETRDVRSCVVIEGWRAARRNAKGQLVCGRHVLVCNGAVLCDEDWDGESFPFVFHHWNAPIRGFWGDSAISEIRGFEHEANISLQRVQEAMRRNSMVYMAVERNASVSHEKVTNEPMTLIHYDGQIAPQFHMPPVAPPQMMENPDRMIRMAANQLGTNELQMSATKPAGVESGRAMEQLSEEHTVRYETVSKAFEVAMSKDLAVAFVAEAKRMDKCLRDQGLPGLRLRSTYKREFIDLKWNEVELGPNEMFIDVWPVSVLPHTPAGRTAEVERWQSNQWLQPDEAKELLEFPDLDSFASVSKASRDLTEWQIASMLDDGKEMFPDPRQDLEYARRFGTLAKLKAYREDYPQAHINLLEDFLAMVEAELAPPPAPPEAMSPNGESVVPPEAMGAPGMEGLSPEMMAAGGPPGMGDPFAPTGLEAPGGGATGPILPMSGQLAPV